jgi:4-amino-4-deoxy-L-arabinose transferase-like glycosyltransferase
VPRSALVGLAAIVGLGLLVTCHLDRYPAPWYDEGVNLQAARNLAESGRYGLAYDGFVQPFDPQMTTGPTVIGPVAASFRVFGPGVLQARAVMAAYALVAGLGLFWVTARLFGPLAGVFAVAVMAGIGDYVGLAEGRSVVGEVAALAYLFLGAGVLLHGWPGQRAPWPGSRATNAQALGRTGTLALAGALFGLAIVTKAQFAVVVPVLLGVCVLGVRSGTLSPARAGLLLVAVGLPVLAWQLFQALALGPLAYLDNLLVVQSLARVSSEAPPLRKLGSNLGDLLSTWSAWPGLLALVYFWVRLRRGDRRLRQPAAMVVPAFATLSWIWFVCFSMGWLRLAVPAITAGSLCLAMLVDDVLAWARARSTRVAPRAAVAALVLGPLALGVARNAALVAGADEVAAYDLAALVDQRVEAGATIETDEWELDLLVRRSAHHPPAAVVADAVGAVELQTPTTLVQSYEAAAGATYLIDGRFSKLDGIYRHALDEGRFARIASLGDYDLYRRVDGG